MVELLEFFFHNITVLSNNKFSCNGSKQNQATKRLQTPIGSGDAEAPDQTQQIGYAYGKLSLPIPGHQCGH